MRLIDADNLEECKEVMTTIHGECKYAVRMDDIRKMPTITVERPHGEWKKTGRTNIYGGFEIECSVCHKTLMVSPNRWKIGENFCDVCGADMRKEGDEK